MASRRREASRSIEAGDSSEASEAAGGFAAQDAADAEEGGSREATTDTVNPELELDGMPDRAGHMELVAPATYEAEHDRRRRAEAPRSQREQRVEATAENSDRRRWLEEMNRPRRCKPARTSESIAGAVSRADGRVNHVMLM